MWRTRRTKVLAALVLLGILWVWLGSGTGNLQPALHHFVKVDGTQVLLTLCVGAATHAVPAVRWVFLQYNIG